MRRKKSCMVTESMSPLIASAARLAFGQQAKRSNGVGARSADGCNVPTTRRKWRDVQTELAAFIPPLCDFLQGNDPDGQRARGGKGEENVEGFSARNGAFFFFF